VAPADVVGKTAPAGRRPRVGITLGDPRGIGPEVAADALADPAVRDLADFVLVGPQGIPVIEKAGLPWSLDAVGDWEPAEHDLEAGRLSGLAIDRAIELGLSGEIDALVTAPISKTALAAAGYPFPGHTEFLQERCGVPRVTMVMAAETTPLGGPLRMALMTTHIPLREVPDALNPDLVVSRTRVAANALRDWWGFPRPRVAFAGINPHASEGGLFGDEERLILEPAVEALAEDPDLEVDGIFPADTVFRRCLDGRVDLVVVPYHDVGLALLKTAAGDTGVNVTAGLPFPRTSPDHGTAFDIAGRGLANASSMKAAIRLCVSFL